MHVKLPLLLQPLKSHILTKDLCNEKISHPSCVLPQERNVMLLDEEF